MKTTTKRLFSVLLAVLMLLSIVPMSASATQSRTEYFSKNYTITGNAANDMLSIAQAQLNKTKSDLAYTEYWCANFVGDCAKLAGQSSAVPMNGYVPTLYDAIIKAGGTVVSSRQKGDIIFYSCSSSSCDTDGDGRALVHVGIVLDSTYSIEGNYSNKVSKVIDYRDSNGHTTQSGTIKRIYLRPAYKGTHSHSYASSITTSPTCYSTGVRTYTCSCGNSYKESISKTSHDYSGKKVYSSTHPHEYKIRCVNYSNCGSYKLTGEYKKLTSCEQCWNVQFTTTKNSISIESGQSTTFTLGITSESIYPEGAQYEYDYDKSIISVKNNGKTYTVTGLKNGKTNLIFTAYSDESLSKAFSSLTIPVTVTGVYKIKYNANGGKNAPEAQTKKHGETITLRSEKPTKEGYIFLGWSTSSTTSTPNSNYNPGNTYKQNSNLTLYAVWKKAFYGDINNDGKISVSDITLLANMISGKDVTSLKKMKGDLNGDGKLNEKDQTLLNEFKVGNIYEFPVESMLKSLEVKSQPSKTKYVLNDKITADGFKVKVVYTNNVSYTITSGFELSPSTASKTGEQRINVNLGNISTHFYITVYSTNHTHEYVSKVVQTGTCTQQEITENTCSICGSKITAYSIAPGHSWKAATCTTKKTCSRCGATTGSALGHNYTSKITKTATCTTTGTKKFTCSKCSKSYTEEISKLAHTYSKYTSDKNATYKADGTKTAKCTYCGKKKTVTDKGSRLSVKKPYSVKIEEKDTSIKLTWSKSAGADGYRIYKRTSSGREAIVTTTKLTYTITNLKANTAYTFEICPYVTINGTKVWSEYSRLYVSTTPAIPTSKVSSPSKGKVTVSWKAVSGAEKYQLYYKTGNGSYKLYNTYTSAKSLTFKNLKSKTKYTFAVRACKTYAEKTIRSPYKAVSVTVK